ncbi:MAG: hypothetical protein U0T83_01935 [Bacteriovoracaceae bacterium]
MTSVKKRSIYLVDKAFQMKFAGFVCTFVLLCSIVYPLTIYELFNSFIANTANTIPANVMTETRTKLIISLIVYQCGFTAIVFIVSIFQSHKIAGPLYKLKKYFLLLKSGEKVNELHFRKGDNFKELADLFNDAVGHIQETQIKDFAYLSEVSSYINNLALVVPDDKKVVLHEIVTKLNEIQARFKLS